MATDVKELMAKVGKIRILTNRLIDDQLAGDYHSTFKGQGVEFDEVRPYIAGDDVRTIDWNVTARTGVPYIKRYSEERELTILFLVDVSGSQSYGSRSRSKMELAAEVTALLALTAIRNQDKIGLVLFSDRIVKYIPPRKGRDSVMRLVREVLAAEDEAKGGTDVEGVLKFLNGVQKRRAVVFLVSDFITGNGERETGNGKRGTGNRCESRTSAAGDGAAPRHDMRARVRSRGKRASRRRARRARGFRDRRAHARRHLEREGQEVVRGKGGKRPRGADEVLPQDRDRHARHRDGQAVHRRRPRSLQATRKEKVGCESLKCKV